MYFGKVSSSVALTRIQTLTKSTFLLFRFFLLVLKNKVSQLNWVYHLFLAVTQTPGEDGALGHSHSQIKRDLALLHNKWDLVAH